MSQRFKALTDFEDPDTKSQYCRGLKYAIRTPTLKTKVDGWVAEGKVELVADNAATVQGTGETK